MRSGDQILRKVIDVKILDGGKKMRNFLRNEQ